MRSVDDPKDPMTRKPSPHQGTVEPKVTAAQMLDLLDGHFSEIRNDIGSLQRRLTQTQRQLDEAQSFVKHAVTRLLNRPS